MLPEEFWYTGIRVDNPYASALIMQFDYPEPFSGPSVNYDFTPGPRDWKYPPPVVIKPYKQPWILRIFPPGFPVFLLPLILTPFFTAVVRIVVEFIIYLLKK
jgi:hypothetical protein